MKKGCDNLRVLWLAFFVCSIVAVALTIRTCAGYGQRREWIAERVADLNALAQLDQGLAQYRAATHTMDEFAGAALPDLERVLSEQMERGAYEIQMGATEDLADGWRISKASIIFEQIGADRLFDLIAELERLRPPWRVVGVSIQPLPGSPGDLRASVNVEGLERF